ncbi:YcbK family protein [Capnocytophaga canis]|nr:D-Ala-D-Ala carboxypeptidase family metallohydrolase [Capnocytophaga canis]
MLRKKISRAVRYVVGGNVTPHFKWAEFDCNDGTRVPDDLLSNVKELATNLEVIRKEAGNKPIRITSGYRTFEYNKKVGGVEKSQHLIGKAADIKIKGMTSIQVYTLITNLIRQGKIKKGGVGLYPTFVHYDIRGFETYWRK